MKSKITIDVIGSPSPVITIEQTESDDVRDKLVKNFLDSLGNYSYWCRVDFHPMTENADTRIANIVPLRLDELEKEISFMLKNIAHCKSIENV